AKGGGEASTAARSPAEEALWEAIHKEIRRLLDECEDDPLSVAIDIEQLRKNLKDEYGISVGLKKLRALPNNPAFESYLQSKGLECVWNDDEHTTLLVLPIGPKLTVKPKETGPTEPDAETLEDINGPFIPRGHPSRKRFATGRPEEEKKEPSSNAQCISNTAIGGAETLISVGEEKALRASAQSLLELFQKMGYEEFLHAEDRDIKNLEVVNTDRDGLIYPEGANVAIAMEMNGGMQAAAYWASRDHFKNTNMILIPLTDSILIDRKNPYKLFVKIGLFFNKQGRLVLGRFEEPIPVHAISIPFYKPTKTFQYLDRTGVPNVGTSDAVAYTDDKAWTGRFFQENDIPTPQFDTITPGASDEEIKARIESAFEKYPEAQIIIKPANGVWGQDMREFGAEEMPNDFHHAKSILERGETVLIQGEVFPCLWAHTDYNLRVMTTWKGDEVITTEDMIEVKYRKLSERGAVNVSQGAGTMSLSEFFDTVGLRETAERIEFLQDLISSSKEDTLRLEDELSSKRAYPGLHKNVGIGGWDLMVEADRKGKIFFTRLEVNAVAVGNIKTMEGLLPQNKKGNAVLPIAEYLVDLAYKYKQQNPNIRFSGEGEYLNLLEQPFHAFSYGFSMLKLGEIALARRLFDVYKKVDPDNEFSRQRPDLIKAMKEYEENSLTKKDRTILAYTGRYPSDDETEDAPRAGPTAPDAKPLRRGKVTYGYFYPPAVDTTDIIFNGERISAADVRSKRNKAINVHEGTLNFNIRIDKDTVEIGFPSDDRYTRHRDIKNPSCEDEGTFRVYFGGMPNEDIYLIPDKVLRDNSSGKPIFLDDQKRYHNDVIRMARCLIECGFPSSSLFGHMKRILGRYMLFPSPQPQTLGELAARPYLTGEITIDIEKAKEAFETVFQDIADKFARTKNKELAELNNEEKEELQSRFTGFVHCHEIFHQLVVLAGISFANEEEECELADIFATRAMGLEVIESDHQARLNAFAEQVADDGIRRQLTLRYHTEGFLLNLHSLGVNIYNIKAEAIKNVPPGAKAMSRDKKVWGKNVTKETLAEMVEAGSFDASEKGREGYLFAMEVIRATVECRHPDLDENTRIIINSHIPQILRSMMVRAEFTQTFGHDMENLVNQMWKALENPGQLNFSALETYMRTFGEINICLTEHIIRKYAPQSPEVERLFNSLIGRFDDFENVVNAMHKFPKATLTPTAWANSTISSTPV
ncbi:MAG: hypothetical protein HQ594_05660, partial [Candidatus Omnitrophica bacterium]|nr:hypothetical protein [Candidatus Omnitrophota bacterium]